MLGRKAPELEQSRLVGMQFQVELREAFGAVPSRNRSAHPMLETNHDVVRKAHDDHIAVRLLRIAMLGPTGRTRNGDRRWPAAAILPPWGVPIFAPRSLPILQHAGVQPFLDQPHDAPVRDPMLDELHQPFVVESIEETADVHIEHPVHLPRQDPDRERIQRMMRAAPWPEPVRESEKVRFVDGVQAPRPPRAGRSCLPAREPRAVAAARRSWGCTPYAPASLGTLLASAFRRDPGGSPPGSRRSAATSRRPRPPRHPASAPR